MSHALSPAVAPTKDDDTSSFDAHIAAVLAMIESARAHCNAVAEELIRKAETEVQSAENHAVDVKDDTSRSAADAARKKLIAARTKTAHAFNRFVPLILIPFRVDYFGGDHERAGLLLTTLIQALQSAAERAPAPAAALVAVPPNVAMAKARSIQPPVQLAVDIGLIFTKSVDYHAAQFARKKLDPEYNSTFSCVCTQMYVSE
jgi:hypothetical protein